MELRLCAMLDPECLKSLNKWLTESNVKLTHINGQRKYGGPPDGWVGPMPGEGCEVFISGIPRDVFEDRLIPLFSAVGPLWEFRLMMNFSGQNRGFAFAKYGSLALAEAAIHQLNGHMLEHKVWLNVCHSTEKHHLCISELPDNTKRKELLEALCSLTEGVAGLSLKMGPGIKGTSALVTYSSHHAASMAKKVLVEALKKHFAVTVSVKWHLHKSTTRGPAAPPRASKPQPLKPPRHVPVWQQPCLSPHPRLISHDLLNEQGDIQKAVVGPHGPSTSPVLALSPVSLLNKMCEARWVSRPFFGLKWSHAGPDGYLYFDYSVRIPHLIMPFTGQVGVLPAQNPAGVLEEAYQAAAKQVLRALQALNSESDSAS